jgi:hypothetical protein
MFCEGMETTHWHDQVTARRKHPFHSFGQRIGIDTR